MEINEDVWKSSDYYLCSYLLACDFGMKLIGVEGQKPRLMFILTDPDSKKRDELTQRYMFENEDMVSASKLFSKQKVLQKLLRNQD